MTRLSRSKPLANRRADPKFQHHEAPFGAENSLVKHHSKQAPFPSKEEILAFIGDKPGQIGTREIARAFNLKNDRRVELKRMLRELADEGRVEAQAQEAAPPRRPAVRRRWPTSPAATATAS